jgi:hypothetical protein
MAVLNVASCSRPKTLPTPLAAVEGKVIRAGKPLPGVLITFWPQERERQGTGKLGPVVSETDGSFRLTSSPGRYKVTVIAPPQGAGAPGLESGRPTVPSRRVKTSTVAISERYATPASTPLAVDVRDGGAEHVRLTID